MDKAMNKSAAKSPRWIVLMSGVCLIATAAPIFTGSSAFAGTASGSSYLQVADNTQPPPPKNNGQQHNNNQGQQQHNNQSQGQQHYNSQGQVQQYNGQQHTNQTQGQYNGQGQQYQQQQPKTYEQPKTYGQGQAHAQSLVEYYAFKPLDGGLKNVGAGRSIERKRNPIADNMHNNFILCSSQ